MLNLLLDERISPMVAEGLRKKPAKLPVFSLGDYEEGRLIGQPDDFLLREAAERKLTLVTDDLRTIPPLLKIWAETGRLHGGVIFVDPRTIPPSDFGGLIRALQILYEESARWDWSSRICFLKR